MKFPSLTILVTAATLFWASHQALADEFPLQPLTDAPKSSEEIFFEVEDGEAEIQGEVIELFVVKPEHLTVSYRNRTKRGLFPEYVVRIYNRYGVLLGSEEVDVSLFGGRTKLEPGDVGGEKIRLDLLDVESIFRHTGLNLPDDFMEASWLSLSGSNSKLDRSGGAEAEE